MSPASHSSRGASSLPVVLIFSAALLSTAFGQSITAVSGSGSNVALSANLFGGAFITSNADNAQNAIKNASISAAEVKVVGAVAERAVPIPVVGPLAVDAVMKVFGRRKQTVKGFTVVYVRGLSAGTVLQPDGSSFVIPAVVIQSIGAQGLVASLLRLKPSTKDSVRIAYTLHVALKTDPGNKINPATQEILGTELDAIDCHQETHGNGDIVLTPNSRLLPGEYAVVLLPARPGDPGDNGGSRAWDFRVP